MAAAFIVVVVMLFATVLLWRDEPGLKSKALRPAGLFMWLIAGNRVAKLGGLLVTLGTGALLREYRAAGALQDPGRCGNRSGSRAFSNICGGRRKPLDVRLLSDAEAGENSA